MSAEIPRILVVEDEFLIAEALEDCLQGIGCECVGPAASLGAALSLVESESLDAAILDMRLGEERVDAVADRLSERGVPFAFAVGERTDVDDARWPGALILLKPYSDKDIAGLLSRLLAR